MLGKMCEPIAVGIGELVFRGCMLGLRKFLRVTTGTTYEVEDIQEVLESEWTSKPKPKQLTKKK